MVYLYNIILDEEKKLFSEVCKIYGFRYNKLFYTYKKLGLNYKNNLDLINMNKQAFLFGFNSFTKKANFNLGLNVKQQNYLRIKFKIDINSYQGFRHKFFFPVRGQKTRNNAKTVKHVNFKSLIASL